MLRRNTLRTLLTGLSVAWGMFMLVAAARRGPRARAWEPSGSSATRLELDLDRSRARPRSRTRACGPGQGGLSANEDYEAFGRDVRGIEHLTGRFYLWVSSS